MRTLSPVAKSRLWYLMEQIADSRQVTRTDYLWLTSSLLSNSRLTEEERVQISRIFDHIQTGQLRLVD